MIIAAIIAVSVFAGWILRALYASKNLRPQLVTVEVPEAKRGRLANGHMIEDARHYWGECGSIPHAFTDWQLHHARLRAERLIKRGVKPPRKSWLETLA
jgi:hypothetical protein